MMIGKNVSIRIRIPEFKILILSNLKPSGVPKERVFWNYRVNCDQLRFKSERAAKKYAAKSNYCLTGIGIVQDTEQIDQIVFKKAFIYSSKPGNG